MSLGTGSMSERLTIQRNNGQFVLVSLTRSGTTATATTGTAHNYSAGDYVTIAAATPSGYNGRMKVVTVPITTTFTYTVSGALTTPATGTITATYASDAQGGREAAWTTLATVWGELMPELTAAEGLYAQAIGAQTASRFRVHRRIDVTPKMRVLWTPRWPPSATQTTLEIHGVIPTGRGQGYMALECGELI